MGIGEAAQTAQGDASPGAWFQSFSGGAVHPASLSQGEVRLIDVAHALSLAARFAGHTLRPYSVGEHSVNVGECVAFREYLHSVIAPTDPRFELVAAGSAEIVARLRLRVSRAYPAISELGQLAVGAILALSERAEHQNAVRFSAWVTQRALFHDASEAYLVDLPKPLKVQLAEYKVLESIAQAACDGRLAPRPVQDGCAMDDPEIEVRLHRAIKGADLGVLFVEKARLLATDRPDWSPLLPRDPVWAYIAHAVVSAWPGQLTQSELAAYRRLPATPDGDIIDPHGPSSVRAAIWHLHAFLGAVVAGEDPREAARDLAGRIIL